MLWDKIKTHMAISLESLQQKYRYLFEDINWQQILLICQGNMEYRPAVQFMYFLNSMGIYRLYIVQCYKTNCPVGLEIEYVINLKFLFTVHTIKRSKF